MSKLHFHTKLLVVPHFDDYLPLSFYTGLSEIYYTYLLLWLSKIKKPVNPCRHEVWQPPISDPPSPMEEPHPSASQSPVTTKDLGIPIVPHRVAMDTTESEVVLQTPIGVFHRSPAQRQPINIPTVEVMEADSLPPVECASCESGPSPQKCVVTETVLRSFASLQSHSSGASSDSRSSSPEPLELDLPATSSGRDHMPRLSPAVSPDKVSHAKVDAPSGGRQPQYSDGSKVITESSYLDVPCKREVDRMSPEIYLKVREAVNCDYLSDSNSQVLLSVTLFSMMPPWIEPVPDV